MHVCIYLSVCLSALSCVSVCLCLSVCTSVCLSVCLSIYLSVCLSVCWSVCLSVYIYVQLCYLLPKCSLKYARIILMDWRKCSSLIWPFSLVCFCFAFLFHMALTQCMLLQFSYLNFLTDWLLRGHQPVGIVVQWFRKPASSFWSW